MVLSKYSKRIWPWIEEVLQGISMGSMKAIAGERWRTPWSGLTSLWLSQTDHLSEVVTQQAWCERAVSTTKGLAMLKFEYYLYDRPPIQCALANLGDVSMVKPSWNDYALPSKSSQTTSPVLGQIVIRLTETSNEDDFPLTSSTRHINGGDAYRSKSSTESSPSTYLCEMRMSIFS